MQHCIPTFPGLIRVRRNRLHMKGNKRSLKERRIRSSCYRIGCRYRGGEELRSSVRKTWSHLEEEVLPLNRWRESVLGGRAWLSF